MRLGVGRLLVDDVATRAAASGASYVDVIANPNALGFYERVGFEMNGQASTRFGMLRQDEPRLSSRDPGAETIADPPCRRAEASVFRNDSVSDRRPAVPHREKGPTTCGRLPAPHYSTYTNVRYVSVKFVPPYPEPRPLRWIGVTRWASTRGFDRGRGSPRRRRHPRPSGSTPRSPFGIPARAPRAGEQRSALSPTPRPGVLECSDVVSHSRLRGRRRLRLTRSRRGGARRGRGRPNDRSRRAGRTAIRACADARPSLPVRARFRRGSRMASSDMAIARVDVDDVAPLLEIGAHRRVGLVGRDCEAVNSPPLRMRPRGSNCPRPIGGTHSRSRRV